MNNKTREEKIEIIRGAVNSDDYIELLSDEQIDELCAVSIAPVKDKVAVIYEGVRNIVESIIESSTRR